jgi:hypothetical protein
MIDHSAAVILTTEQVEEFRELLYSAGWEVCPPHPSEQRGMLILYALKPARSADRRGPTFGGLAQLRFGTARCSE